MPKIEVFERSLNRYIGRSMPEQEFVKLLSAAKAELDERVPEEGILKIELNDTNRPDLWSTAGLGRQLRVYLGGGIPEYGFFSYPGKPLDAGGRRVVVDASVKEFRPYIAAFEVSGKPIDEPTLLDLIQTQEKLCWNYGRKRKSIAMGVYRTELMQYPVKYFAADPDKTKFVPLGLERELSLRQIISEHPKGQEFGQIVAEFPRFPFLTDANDEVLSFPPVINSAKIGAVEVGDTNLFVELTGTDYPSLMLTASIVACDLADAGFTIRPVAVEYPYDTVFGRTVTTPLYFQTPVTLEVPYAEKLLGERFTAEEIVGYLAKMGVRAAAAGSKITVTPPEYRNDFLHPVDVIEDIMVGRGMDSFEPVMPEDFTVGRLTAAERFGRQVKNLMVGLGYQEMIYGYLGSKKDYVERMNIPGDEVIRIANPMTESFEFVRPSILPSLLYTESVSGNAAYPHFVFEVGKVAWIDPDQNYGTRTVNSLGLLAADKDAGFNLIYSHLTALMFYLSREFTIREIEDPRFIPGRTAAVMAGDRKIGVFGELHPAVLSNWGITMPCAGGELDLDLLRGE
jgi:phenylalanyl-tRNA synthetase beta chain